ncbi:MAG TPA: hypothetical protein VH684_19880 [Xanthobacteraceae bacterium]|jgi:hypothetical protein
MSAIAILRMTPRARRIVELNIERYRELLKSETDSSKRRTIARLLAEEEAKLAGPFADEQDD